VRSVDLANNRSTIVTRFYTYVTRAPLSIVVNGDGSVAPNLDGRDLELGKTFTVTAKPDAGQIFNRWEIHTNSDLSLTNGVVFSNRMTLSFQMKSNLVLVADFVPNPFPPVVGAYAGLFLDADTNRFRPENAGFFKLLLGNNGIFSGNIAIQGAIHGFAGRFDVAGKSQIGIICRARPPISIAMQLDLSGATGTITGTVTTSSDANTLTSSLLANRKAVPAPIIGFEKFSLIDDGGNSVANALATISMVGGVGIRGVLKPSRNFEFTTSIVSDRSVPFYVSFNRGSEVIAGWLQFGNSETAAVSGELFQVSRSFEGVALLEAVAQ